MTCPERCYICDWDNPDAPEDGCTGCEEEWIRYYVVAYADVIAASEEQSPRGME